MAEIRRPQRQRVMPTACADRVARPAQRQNFQSRQKTSLRVASVRSGSRRVRPGIRYRSISYSARAVHTPAWPTGSAQPLFSSRPNRRRPALPYARPAGVAAKGPLQRPSRLPRGAAARRFSRRGRKRLSRLRGRCEAPQRSNKHHDRHFVNAQRPIARYVASRARALG